MFHADPSPRIRSNSVHADPDQYTVRTSSPLERDLPADTRLAWLSVTETLYPVGREAEAAVTVIRCRYAYVPSHHPDVEPPSIARLTWLFCGETSTERPVYAVPKETVGFHDPPYWFL